jgi:hypothetical protein
MNGIRRLIPAFVLASVVMALVGIAAAQRTTGTLRGQVLDPQGAVVVNARVRVTNDATGIAQELVTTSAGTYNVPSLLPGNYTVTVNPFLLDGIFFSSGGFGARWSKLAVINRGRRACWE